MGFYNEKSVLLVLRSTDGGLLRRTSQAELYSNMESSRNPIQRQLNTWFSTVAIDVVGSNELKS